MKKKKVDSYKDFEERLGLQDGSAAFVQRDDGSYEPMEGPVEIVKVIDVIQDKGEIEALEEASAPGGFTLSTDLSIKEVKRGDTIWLTALLKRPHATTSFNQTSMGVLKCRIVEIYQGLSMLKNVIK